MAGILIIDDDVYISNLLESYLVKHHYNVSVAYSGKAAKKLITKRDFTCILCDFRLPDSDGLEILKHAKAKSLEIPVIIMTAYADLKMAVKLIKAGATDYVTSQSILKKFFAYSPFNAPLVCYSMCSLKLHPW
jgi:two-component system response regulator HydG